MAVTNLRSSREALLKQANHRFCAYFFLFLPLFMVSGTYAAVLPEDRFDILYFNYSGGGMDINGPSVLIRKEYKDKVSLSVNHLVDNVSGASIDVETTASAYTESRTENTLGLSYLHDQTISSVSLTNSDEDDFTARSLYVGISQDFFSGLSNISIGYINAWDEIGKREQNNFKEDARRSHFQLAFSQVITKNLLLNISDEVITDEGFLNNPYRSVRYIDLSTPKGYSFEAEQYPNTRTSNALAVRAIYYLPYRASLMAEYRYFSDTWDIRADTYQLRYIHPVNEHWQAAISYRLYDQSSADFYSDLYPFQNAQNFLARDKELSSFSNKAIGANISYEWKHSNWKHIDRVSLNLSVDYITFDYDNFRDLRDSNSGNVGSEPLYHFSATATRFFLSAWY